MQNITSRLLELDPTLQQHNEGDWHNLFNSESAGFSSFNDAGIECETGEFLYSMVRLLKPSRVLETGTHWGIGASYMGLALKDNLKGDLDTIEFLPEIHWKAANRIEKIGLGDIVTCHLMDVAKFLPMQYGDGIYDMILLDTEPQTRFAELLKFYPYLKDGGFVFIHDLHRGMGQNANNPDHPSEPHWPYGEIPAGMQELVTSGKLRPFHFSTPRGLTGFYKVHPDDHKW